MYAYIVDNNDELDMCDMCHLSLASANPITREPHASIPQSCNDRFVQEQGTMVRAVLGAAQGSKAMEGGEPTGVLEA